MKKLFVFSLIIILCTTTTGCDLVFEKFNEIETLLFVKTIGIDLTDEDENVKVTLQLVHGAKSGERTSFENSIYSAKGHSLTECIDKIQRKTSKRCFFGQTDIVLLGEKSTQYEVFKYLDKISRSHELKISLNMWVAKGTTANDFINETMSKNSNTSEYLDTLCSKSQEYSWVEPFKLYEIMALWDSNPAVSILPVAALRKRSDKSIDQGEEYEAFVDGYAVFKGTSFKGYLNDEEALGVNWIRNLTNNTGLYITINEKSRISANVITCNTKTIPEIFNGKDYKITFNVEFLSTVSEIINAMQELNTETLTELEDKEELKIKEQIESAIKFAKTNDVDIFDLSATIERMKPIKWEGIKNDWENIFRQTNFEVNVKGKIINIQIMKAPLLKNN